MLWTGCTWAHCFHLILNENSCFKWLQPEVGPVSHAFKSDSELFLITNNLTWMGFQKTWDLTWRLVSKDLDLFSNDWILDLHLFCKTWDVVFSMQQSLRLMGNVMFKTGRNEKLSWIKREYFELMSAIKCGSCSAYSSAIGWKWGRVNAWIPTCSQWGHTAPLRSHCTKPFNRAANGWNPEVRVLRRK